MNHKGLVFAIECDKCEAFARDSGERPDLILLRTRDGEFEWLVTEVKAVMDSDALEQVQAGIDLAARSTLLGPADVGQTIGFFAFRKAYRAADMDRLRGGLSVAGKPVRRACQALRSGSDLVIRNRHGLRSACETTVIPLDGASVKPIPAVGEHHLILLSG